MVRRAAERAGLLFVAGYLFILLAACILSFLGRLNSRAAWIAAALGVAAATVAAVRRLPASADARADVASDEPALPRWLLPAMCAAVLIALAVDVVVMVSTAPAAWDALSYHLPKMAYAIQRGSFGMPVANYWAQQVHPDGSTALLVFTYVLSHNERLLAVWQLLAVLVAAAAIRSISLHVFPSRDRAAFAALAFLLTTQTLMQANTVGNDAIIAALAACATLWLLDGRATGDPRWFFLAAVAAGLGMATKASFALVLPLLATLSLFALAALDGRRRRRAIAGLAIGGAMAIAIALAAGYARNLGRYGHPLGPPDVRKMHTFESQTVGARLAGGARNVLRYGVEFVAFDGLPRLEPVNALHRRIRAVVRGAVESTGIDLESSSGVRVPFRYDRIASAHEVVSYWGVIGVLIIWPAVLAALGRPTTSTERLLAALSVGFLLLQAYGAPYDPWRGRYFLTAAVFAAPLAGRWVAVRRRPVRLLRDGAVLLACGSALSATLLRSNRPLIGAASGDRTRPSALSLDRLSQLTANRPDAKPALEAFEASVPPRATVALRLPADAYEFPLFGEGLTRTLLPAPPGVPLETLGPIDYLVFDEQLESVQPSDRPLGSGWWLRSADSRR
jgi:hypothetical protein